MKVYLELGTKKVFAVAEDWPGWCRSARDEAEALQSLVDYRSRYASMLAGLQVEFILPVSLDDLFITDRYQGNAGTDFGGPMVIPACDREAMDQRDFTRQRNILQGCWQKLDQAVRLAHGRELRRGPRGGGRALEKILAHVLEAEVSYLAMIGWSVKRETMTGENLDAGIIRTAILQAAEAAYQGDIEKQGPRGGKRWPLRYFFRRDAWHVLDHAWEIEDRVI